MAGFRTEPFVFMSWGLMLFGWILMLAAIASLQQVRWSASSFRMMQDTTDARSY
jgi:hypothetical protein